MNQLTDLKLIKGAPRSAGVGPNFLTDEFGRIVMHEYNERVKSEYNNNSNLNILSFSDNAVKGSSVFAVPILEDILSEVGFHVATLADLERFIDYGELTPNGNYKDVGVALKNKGSYNEYYAKNLTAQIRERNGGKKLKMPVYVNLRDLKTVNDSEAPHGLGLELRDSARIIYAPQLKGNIYRNNKFSEANEDGMPIFDKDGNRRLSAPISYCLSRVWLDSSLDLVARRDLETSGNAGRVIISDGVASQNK